MSSNPQSFRIVKCFSCSIYQVDIEKKSTNKWQCKLCGSKQTLKQVFYESDSAKECRERVKQLNSFNGQRQTALEENNINRNHQQQQQQYYDEEEESAFDYTGQTKKVVSKWAKYLTKNEFDKFYGQSNQEDYNNEEEKEMTSKNTNFY